MNETDKEKVKRLRLTRLARRMERVAIASQGLQSDSGDPFDLELNANLTHIAAKADRWGNRQRRGAHAARKRRIRNGFKPPKIWKQGKQRGISILEKALIYMSTFREKGLGFRDLQILMLITGYTPLSIQQAADVSGITYYSALKQIRKMEKMGLLKITSGEPVGGKAGPLNIEVMKRGNGILYALNRFNSKTSSYDRLIATSRVTIHTDTKLLQMDELIADAKELTQDI